jgi:hypothetical protein
MSSLRKATVDQIVDELCSRDALRFALVTVTKEADGQESIHTVSSAGYLDGSRLLIEGAQDLLESLRSRGPHRHAQKVGADGVLAEPERN